MLEAMSCGTPVVAFDIGGMPDVIADGITGRLVECGNETRLGNAILELVLHDADRRMMGAASSILIREKFNPEVQANAYLGLYNDLLKQDVRYKVGVVPSVKRYGPSTSRIYSKLLQFSIQNQMRIQFDIHVKSKLILYFMSFMLRFIVRIMPITIFIRIRGFLRKIVSTLRGYSYMFVFLSFHSK
jgi:hypothetical protein